VPQRSRSRTSRSRRTGTSHNSAPRSPRCPPPSIRATSAASDPGTVVPAALGHRAARGPRARAARARLRRRLARDLHRARAEGARLRDLRLLPRLRHDALLRLLCLPRDRAALSRARACTAAGRATGLTRVLAALFEVTIVILILRRRQRPAIRVLLHLLWLVRRRRRLHRLPALARRTSLRPFAARGRLWPQSRDRRQRQPHRGRRARPRQRSAPGGNDRRLHLAQPAACQRAALARRAQRSA